MFAQISILFKENSKLSVGSLVTMFALIFNFLLNTKGTLDLALNNSHTFVNIIALTAVVFIGVLCTFFVYARFSSKKEKSSEQKIVTEEESTSTTASVSKKKKWLFIALLISSCIMVLVSVFLIVGIRQMRHAELHYIALTDELNPEECRKFKADIEKMSQTDAI
jgi:H+/gluconate symporter-like permease